MPLNDLIAIAGTVLLNASAQIFLRAGLRGIEIGSLMGRRDFEALLGLVVNLNVLGGLGCYVFSVVLWMYVLSRLPVGVAYPMMSLAYIVAVLMGWMILGESFSWPRLFGVFVISLGVWIVARNASHFPLEH